MHKVTLRCGNHRFDRSFTAIGNRDRNILRIGENFPKSFFYCLSYLGGRKAFFIRVWGNYDFHSYVA